MAISTIGTNALGASAVALATQTSGVLPAAALPVGTIKQVVMGTATASASTSGTTYVATNLSATITPSSASNKILVWFSGPAYSGGVNYVYVTVYRNGTTNLGFSGANALGVTGNNPGTYDTSIASMYLDSPATTSAVTYTVYVKSSGGNNAVFGDAGASGQIMILQEVVA